MPKRKRSDCEEHDSVSGEEDDDESNLRIRDGQENDADIVKRKCQLSLISLNTSSSSEPTTTIDCVPDSPAQVTIAAPSFASLLQPPIAKTDTETAIDDGHRKTLPTTKVSTVESPPKKRVRFDGVTVYYFHRSQGFTCVPTSGGNTLGMIGRHHTIRRLSLSEHELEQNYQRRQFLTWNIWPQQQSPGVNGNCNGMETTGTSSFYPPPNKIGASSDQTASFYNAPALSASPSLVQHSFFNGNNAAMEETEGEDEEEEEEDDEDEDDEDEDGEEDEEEDECDDNENNINSKQMGSTDQVSGGQYSSTQPTAETTGSNGSTVYATTQEYEHDQVKDNTNSNRQPTPRPQSAFLDDGFLQPLGSRERRSLLRESGVDLDSKEKTDCHSIRLSRQVCGCDCRGQCLPETCSCARENIKCQVDRPSFPCGCTKQGCMNPRGRVEFNPLRVRTHYLNTMMRLRMESRLHQELPSPRHTRFSADDTYTDYREGEEVAQYNSMQPSSTDCGQLEGQRGQPSSTGFPAFHTFFTCSNSSSAGQTTTICNERSYWRLEAGASNFDPSTAASAVGLAVQSKNACNIQQHLNAAATASVPSWGCLYNAEEAHRSYCGAGETAETARASRVIYEDSNRTSSTTASTEGAMYTLTALYARDSSGHLDHGSSGDTDHSHRHLYGHCDLNASSFQEYSSASYPAYVSSSFPMATYRNGPTANGVSAGERCKQEQAEGKEESGRGFDRYQQIAGDGNADSSDSSDASCQLPSSPPPPELGAVLKKSICETALA